MYVNVCVGAFHRFVEFESNSQQNSAVYCAQHQSWVNVIVVMSLHESLSYDLKPQPV